MKPPIGGDDVVQLIAHATAGNTDQAADILGAIAERGGFKALYATSCALAEATIQLTGLAPTSPEDFIALQITPATGSREADRARVWAGQFLAAHANRDHDQSYALFLAAQTMAADPLNPVELVDRMSHLLLIAAATVRASPAAAT